MMSLWDALRMNMMISYQELVRTFLNIPIIELIIFTLFVFPLTIILFRALSHGNSIVFINF